MHKGFLVVAAISLLAGGASSGAATGAPRGGDPAAEGASFPTPGSQDTFTVPAGIRSLDVIAVGGEGGDSGGVQGGQAAQVAAPLTVEPGDAYLVKVAELGTDAGSFGAETSALVGGGTPGLTTFNSQILRRGGGGGGASDIRFGGGDSLADRILVAGGGGGAGAAGNSGGGAGGAGGDAGLVGAPGSSGGSPTTSERGGGGFGATESAGGGGGAGADPPNDQDGQPGGTGTLGQGGSGGDLVNVPAGPAGGGGGGLYGGGGGGSGGTDTSGADTAPGGGGGGGGGSSLVPAGGTASTAPQGTQPSITFTWIRPGTTLTKVPKPVIETNKKRKRVKIEFTSTDGAPTFLCQVDSEPETPCVSPATVKLERGRHTLRVRSIGANGNEDVTPAKTKVRIKRRD